MAQSERETTPREGWKVAGKFETEANFGKTDAAAGGKKSGYK